jgi:predicted lipoprotein with Yx(FWY)xxD motif
MRSKLVLALAASAVMALAACGSDDSSSGSDATTAPAATTTAPAAATTAASSATTAASSATTAASPATTAGSSATTAASGAVSVKVADTALGKILVNGQGRTLYMFKSDTGGVPTCSGSCAEIWPAALVEGTPVAEGVDTEVTTVPALAGGQQLKVDEYPLYLFTGDVGPGDTNGQGISNVWFVVGADGEPIES